MARCEVHELEDALSEVSLHDVYALFLQMLVEMAFLCQHRLALHHFPDSVAVHDIDDDAVILLCVLCPVYVGSVLCGSLLEHLKIVSQMCYGVFLYVVCRLAQVLPFWYVVCEGVTALAHAPECLVVA